MKYNQQIIDSVISPNFLKTIPDINIPAGYDTNKPTMLIVDDYNSIVKLFKKLLKRSGLDKYFNIIYSSGPNVGVDVIKKLYTDNNLKIDVVLADITYGSNYISNDESIHGFNGIILTNILRKINPNLIYLFITGHILSGSTASGLFNCYKDIADDDLLDHVVYKETPISTNIDLLKNLFKGTKYEKLL